MSVTERPPPADRVKSSYSFRSDKSHGSGKQRRDSQRESFDKRRTTMSEVTKANPNAAMNEAQPIAAALEKPTLTSLRSFSYNDANGHTIAEPDLSNPTRSRWERPLDTIRSFEAAIDDGFKRRSHYRPESSHEMSNGYVSRRGSYYGGDSHFQKRHSYAAGHYGGGGHRDSYADGNLVPPIGPRNRYNQRMQSDYAINRSSYGYGVYPSQSHQQSRDTVSTGISNGSHSDPMGYSTDPSSDNSSIDRNHPSTKPEPSDHYGFSGFGGGPQYNEPILEEYGDHITSHFSPPARTGPNGGDYFGRMPGGPPPVIPAKNDAYKANGNPARYNGVPSRSTSGPAPARPTTLQRGSSEKRKSWFKRKFGKD